MLGGVARWWVVVVALLACAVPPPASAQEGPADQCAQVGDIAELIMRERQHGATMDDLIQIERQYPADQRGAVEVAIIASFQFPQHDSEEEREAAAKDFRAWMQSHFCQSAQ